jgi:hypothetical protein
MKINNERIFIMIEKFYTRKKSLISILKIKSNENS